MSKSHVRRAYTFLLAEQDSESPHCYTFDGVPALNTVIADVGAAEGNFSLQFIERFKTVYLFECEDEWIEALQATFAPWKDKVHIVKALVSDREADGQISLDSYFKDKEKPTLLKMDVEGYEEQVLKGADALISNTVENSGDPKPELLACTYHRKDDAVKLADLLRKKGFWVKLSAKYMLFQNEFRKGLLHATPVAMAKINGEHPLVSVIVPVYNPDMSLLEECLDSIRLQTYSRTEIILVDDKSADPQVFPWLLKWKEAHREKSITALQNEANSGVSWARKNGIDHAAGEYLMLVDQDDFLSYSCIELLLQKAMETNAELVIGGVTKVLGHFNKNDKYDVKTPKDYLLAALNGVVRRTLWGNLIKTASLKKIGFPLAPKNHFDNDIYVCFHFACNFLKIVSLEDHVYFWRHLNSSFSHSMKLKERDDLVRYDQEIFDLLQKQPFYREIENDVAYHMLCTHIGRFLVFNGKKASTDFYDQFFKNKVALKKLSRFERFVLTIDRIYIFRHFYIVYANCIKPVLKKRVSRFYIYLTNK